MREKEQESLPGSLQMGSPPILQSIAAGFLATCAMTVALFIIPSIGLRQVDVVALFGTLLAPQWPVPYSAYWWLGMILYVISYSVIFPLLYAYLLPSLNGLAWGVMLWLLMEMGLMPLAGRGFFGATQPFLLILAVGSLGLHLIYGAVWSVARGGTTSHDPPAEP
jgi:hypothetical protein